MHSKITADNKVSPHQKGGLGECRERRVSLTVMWIMKLEGCTLFWSSFQMCFLRLCTEFWCLFFKADKHQRNIRSTTLHNFSHAKPQAVNHFSLQMPRVNPTSCYMLADLDKLKEAILQISTTFRIYSLLPLSFHFCFYFLIKHL